MAAQRPEDVELPRELRRLGFGLFRSDPDAQRHKGITYFMFDLRSPGVTVRPIDQLDGEPGFAEIFLENVFVPDDPANPGDSGVIGGVNELARRDEHRLERAWPVVARPGPLPRGNGPAAGPVPYLPSARRRRAAEPGGGRVDRCAGVRAVHVGGTVTRLEAGGELGAESSINKVFWSEWDIATHETALALQGPEAELVDSWTDGYLFSLSGPIYAGTNEIQKNVIAERLLGLPKGDR